MKLFPWYLELANEPNGSSSYCYQNEIIFTVLIYKVQDIFSKLQKLCTATY